MVMMMMMMMSMITTAKKLLLLSFTLLLLMSSSSLLRLLHGSTTSTNYYNYCITAAAAAAQPSASASASASVSVSVSSRPYRNLLLLLVAAPDDVDETPKPNPNPNTDPDPPLQPPPPPPLVSAQLRPRTDISAADAPLSARLSALARLDSARLSALNRQIDNAIIARRSGSGFASSGGATFHVSAGPGVYTMDITLGTPPRTFPMIMDTGSQLVWMQCQPCRACVKQSVPIFVPNASSTYTPLLCSTADCQNLPGQCDPQDTKTCRYTYSYASQANTQGQLGTDTLTFATNPGSSDSVPGFTFGCGFSNQGEYGGAAGLVGMGQGPLSLPSQLGPRMGGKRFSYCLMQQQHDPAASASIMLLGAAAEAGPDGMAFTPMLQNPSVVASLYYINVDGFSVDGRRLDIPADTFSITPQGAGGMILDSGTTYTYLPSVAFTEIKKAFDAAIKLVQYKGHPFLPACYSGPRPDVVPPVTLHLKGAVDLALPQDNYFIRVDGNETTFCLAMIPTTGGLQVVGNMLHQNFRVLYDLDNSRIGFLPQTCSS